MVEAVIVAVLVLGMIVGPLGWRVWHDRAEARALGVRADVHAAATRVLGGESLLSIDVQPPLPWRRGRIVLTAPRRWEWLVAAVVKPALERTPADYDLVVPATGPAVPAKAARELKVAA